MSPEQSRTLFRLVPGVVAFAALEALALWRAWWTVAGLAMLAFVLFALYVEIRAVQQGGGSTESELTWTLWAREPWIPWLISVELALLCGFILAQHATRGTLLLTIGVLAVGFLCGHFFSQSSRVYVALRRERRSQSRAPEPTVVAVTTTTTITDPSSTERVP